MTVQKITSKAQFDQLVASGKTIFVDFYADWCGPCKMISPIFGKLAGAHAREGVEFYQVNIDDVSDLAAELKIRSIPTFHVYKNGGRVEDLVGANPGGLEAFVINQV